MKTSYAHQNGGWPLISIKPMKVVSNMGASLRKYHVKAFNVIKIVNLTTREVEKIKVDNRRRPPILSGPYILIL